MAHATQLCTARRLAFRTYSVDCYLRFNIVFVLLTLGGDFDRISLSDDADITFEVSLSSSCYVVRVGEQCPFMVELTIWEQKKTFIR
jgi:hypothetical protein